MLPESLSWLNAKFVQDVLKSSENDDSIEVKDAIMKFASEIGDNYTSQMIRINVEYSRGNSVDQATVKKSLIVKVAPNSGEAKEIIDEIGVFDTEMRMMTKTLVEMNEMLNDEGCRLSANVLYTKIIGDPTIIVMEDLMTLGYKMADRLTGLDLEHSILVMRALARFHATSIAIREKNSKAMDGYLKNPFHSEMPKIVEMCEIAFKSLANELLNWHELGSSRQMYSEKFLKMNDKYREIYISCTTPKIDEFTVLNHGDCWTNNMLFRYNDEGKVIDHIFVDFQISSVSSPALDILYFFASSLADDVEIHHRDELLKEYLNSLTKTMTRLRCTIKPPNMTGLKELLKKYEFLEIMGSCLTLPFVLVDKNEAMTLNEILGDMSQNLSPGYKSPAYRRKMTRRIPLWNANGTLDL